MTAAAIMFLAVVAAVGMGLIQQHLEKMAKTLESLEELLTEKFGREF